MNQRRAPPERKNCTVSCDHVRTSISRFTERTQTYGSIGTHQEQAPGYPYMLPFSHRATITVGATLLPACLTRSNPRQSFAIRTHAGRTHKFQVVAVEDVQGRAGEKVHEEVGTFHEEVPQGFNVTRSQYFISVSNSFIYGTPSTSLVHSTSFRLATVSSMGHPQRHLFTVLLFGWDTFITTTLSIATYSSIKHTICELNPADGSGARDTNAQRHTLRSRRTAPARKRRQFNQARRDAKSRDGRHPTAPTRTKTQHPTSPKHLPRTRTKPPAQRRLLTSALYRKTSIY